jgi:chromosome segregation ATPase
LSQQLDELERGKSEAESALQAQVMELQHNLAEAEGIIQAASDTHEIACREIASLRAELGERQQSLVEARRQLAACEVTLPAALARFHWGAHAEKASSREKYHRRGCAV